MKKLLFSREYNFFDVLWIGFATTLASSVTSITQFIIIVGFWLIISLPLSMISLHFENKVEEEKKNGD